MATITFIYNSLPTTIQCQKSEIFKDIFQKFSNKVGIKVSELFFIYGGISIKSELTFNQVAKEEDKKSNKMTVLAYNYEKDNGKDKGKVQSIDIICPKCSENCLIIIKDYKIQFYECRNGHILNDVSLEGFNNTQTLDESKILCGDCNIKDKASCYNKEFFTCLQCKKNLCPLCKSSHNKRHDIIDFNQNNYICFNHNEKYSSFCKKCKINLCIECESSHKDKDNIIYFRDILPNKDIVNSQINELQTKINKYKEMINDLKNLLDKIILNLEQYYKINDNLMRNYEKKKRNYHLLKNIKEISKNNINVLNDLNKIVDENNLISLFKASINFINKIDIKFNGKSVPTLNENNEKNKYENLKDKNNYEKLIFLAMLAEQCCLYKDMKYFLEVMIKNKKCILSSDERNLFSIACKHNIAIYRKALRTIEAYKNKEKINKNSAFLAYIIEYKPFVENEMYELCSEIIKFIDDSFINKTTFNQMNEEEKVFYLKMKADYNKYLAESEIHKEITSDEALKYYNECLKISEKMSFWQIC